MKNYYSDSSIFYHQEPFEGEDYLSGATNISIYSSELPVWLKKAKSLKYLSINSDGIDTLPLWLKDLNTLEEIEIDCQNEATSKMKIFPKEIFEIKQVKKLKINRSGLQELPPITGAYENVDLLNNSGLDNRQVLEALCHAPNLVDYTLPSSMSLKYSYGKANPEVYYFDKFFKSVCKKRAKLKTEGLQVKEVQILKNLFYKSGLEQYSKEDFLPILNSSVGKYRQMVLEHLNESFNTVLG
ncbi:MAG: hypothetical protein MRY83_03135, partial [Flavobacteriales bacterium]|nr:hypothetical protein [Flavobacteriales bacterium]